MSGSVAACNGSHVVLVEIVEVRQVLDLTRITKPVNGRRADSENVQPLQPMQDALFQLGRARRIPAPQIDAAVVDVRDRVARWASTGSLVMLNR